MVISPAGTFHWSTDCGYRTTIKSPEVIRLACKGGWHTPEPASEPAPEPRTRHQRGEGSRVLAEPRLQSRDFGWERVGGGVIFTGSGLKHRGNQINQTN